jgi:hypothetical protein
MRDGRLTDVAARREVAGAHLRRRRELANDRQPDGIGEGLEQSDFRIRGPLHGLMLIDNHLY